MGKVSSDLPHATTDISGACVVSLKSYTKDGLPEEMWVLDTTEGKGDHVTAKTK